MSARVCRSGDAFRTAQKLEKRYDDADAQGVPQSIVDWINATLESEANYEKCTSTSWNVIADFLKDGVVLCKLVNKLLGSDGKEKVNFKAKAKMQFVAMSNIEAFNKGAESYGLPVSATFQTVDLVDNQKGPMINVLNCISALGMLANSKGFQPKFKAVEAPKADY